MYVTAHFRFSDISGKFDADKFYDAYSFLDKYQVRILKTVRIIYHKYLLTNARNALLNINTGTCFAYY